MQSAVIVPVVFPPLLYAVIVHPFTVLFVMRYTMSAQ